MNTKRVIWTGSRIFLTVILGGIFIASGFLKLFPVEYFEYNFVRIHAAGWSSAPFIARGLIGLEIFIGSAIVLHLALRRSLKIAIALLVFFSIYLIIEIIIEGNSGDCGCFGTYLSMTPLQSIFKNIALLLISIFLLKFHTGWKSRFDNIIYALLIITALALPFILNPVNLNVSVQRDKESLFYPLHIDTLYSKNEIKPMESLSKGKHIIGFISLRCEHCQLAAYKFHVMKERNPSLPVFFFIAGKQAYEKEFYEKTLSQNIASQHISDEPFLNITGGEFPVFFFVRNDTVQMKKYGYLEINPEEITEWLEK